MTISTDASIVFHGTTDPVDDTTTSSVADGIMSVAADIAAWTNTDDAPSAQLILNWQYPSGTISGNISIHVRPINIDGTGDPSVPTETNPIGFAGNFEISTAQVVLTDTPAMVIVPLVNFMMKTSQEYEFYIYNQSGAAISAGWDLDIVPMTYGPKA